VEKGDGNMKSGSAGAPPDHDEPLERVASFAILEEIGRGGMGIVYRARDLKLEREVALKRPLPEYLERPDFHKRFMAEARSASKLMHPSITTVFEVFEDKGIPWMVMELIDGASLRSMLTGQHPIPLENVLRYAEGLTDALRVAHLGGILHRDINPNNILVGMDGRARLSDFGLARAWRDPESGSSGSDDSTATRSAGWVAGTRGYMSPEQALGKSMDPRSDIFSLGLVYYEMCTGRAAFDWRESDDWLDALLHREPEPISRINAEVPIEFQEIVRKAIAKRTFQRYQSANEMLLDVRATRRKLLSDTGSGPPPIRWRPRKLGKWYAVGGAIAVAVAAVVGWKSLSSPPTSNTSMGWRPRQITSAPGWETEPALSPDGTMIAYISNESGNPDVWLADSGGGNPLQLTDHPSADRDPAWYPDGSTIAFVSDRGGEPAIWKVPRFGGSPLLVLPDARDPAISRDGEHIAFSRSSRDGFLRIGVAAIDDVSKVRILTGDGQGFWNHEDPAWSPDGKTLCFCDFRDLWLVPVDGGEDPRRLTNEQQRDRDPVWSADGRWVYFSSEREGTAALWRVPVTGGPPERLTLGTGPEREPSLSRTGDRLAYSTFERVVDIVVVDMATGERTFLSGGRRESSPVIAPDGRSLIFGSNRAGKFDLWRQQLDGIQPVGAPIKLTDLPGSIATCSFSPDGAWIACYRVIGTQRDIWVFSEDGGVPTQFTEHPGTDIHPSFSPDGSMLAFASDREEVQSIWIAPISEGRRTGDARRVSGPETPVAMFPAWSPDGSRIAFVAESEVWIIGVDPPSEARRVTEGAIPEDLRWEPSGEHLLVAGSWGTHRVELRRVAVVGGAGVPFDPPITFGAEEAPGSFDLSADGRTLALLRTTKGGDIWLVKFGGEGGK